MSKSKLFLGILSLAAAVGLVIANLTLPASSIWFDLGYGNWPWAPPIIFSIIGVILLAMAGIGQPSQAAPAEQPRPAEAVDPDKAALNKRLETIAWGCFLILWAGSMFWHTIVPNNPIREGVWSVAVGLLLLGLNVARYYNKLKMSGFTTVLGIISILGGVVQLFGVRGMEGAFLLLILGAYLILKPWFEKRRLFGKAESE